jgi:ankyrin repeat protein
VLLAAAACTAAPTALHTAAANGDTAVVREWIAKKRNLDVTYDDPRSQIEGNYARTLEVTPLMTAAHFGRREVVQLLVEAGANLYAESHWPGAEHRRNAFDYAVEAQQLEVARDLWSKGEPARQGVRLPEHIGALCKYGCERQSPDMARFLLGIAPDASTAGAEFGTAICRVALAPGGLDFLGKQLARVPRSGLHCVAYGPLAALPLQKRLEVASWLLEHGADPNDRSLAWTPLTGAAMTQQVEMVKLLLARGADPNIRSIHGLTAIGHVADSCARGDNNPGRAPQLAMVEFLAGVSDENVYASAEERSKADLLRRCCAEEKAADQQRICAVFGL